MKLLFRATPANLESSFERLLTTFRGQELLVFQAMEKATVGRRRAFVSPTNSADYPAKDFEMRKLLKSGLSGGIDLMMRLMEHILATVNGIGGVPGMSAEMLHSALRLNCNHNVEIVLSRDGRWLAEWQIRSPYDNEYYPITVTISERTWGEVVPSYVLQYISSAFTVYSQGMSATAVALLSIATEATLRDLLSVYGYAFDVSGSSVDVYDYCDMEVEADGNRYAVSFPQAMPKTPFDFQTATAGQKVKARIRRLINVRKNRVDLSVIAPQELVDHWSLSHIMQAATKRVNGLGEAFDIARNKEGLIDVRDLPLDLEDVIQKVRNNLIHLSGDALNVEIPEVQDPDDPGQFIKLGKFLETPEMVLDLISSIPAFIDGQYVRLRQAGHLAT